MAIRAYKRDRERAHWHGGVILWQNVVYSVIKSTLHSPSGSASETIHVQPVLYLTINKVIKNKQKD